LTTLVRLQYIWLKRSDVAAKQVYVKRGVFIGWLCAWLELGTTGRETEDDEFDGYLDSLWESLGGDTSILRSACEAHTYCAELRAILLIAQRVRYIPGETPKEGKPPLSPRDVLMSQASNLSAAFADCGLDEPTSEEVWDALNRYRMLSDDEIGEMM